MQGRLKVLLVAHIGHMWGGPAKRYSDLVNSSLSQKVDLTFLDSSENKKTFSGGGAVNFENIANFFVICGKFIQTMYRVRPSIVHIASTHGFSFIKHSILIIMAKFWNSKVILAPHCSIKVFIPKSKISYLWMKFVLQRCDGMIVFSNEWLSIANISPKTHIILLRNSIKLVDYLLLDRHENRSNGDVKIIYLGHIGVDKGIMDLIDAVKILCEKGKQNFQVRIYGEDLHQGELQEAIAKVNKLRLEDTIIFHAPVFGSEKMEVFREADIFVLPSHYEGLPISIIEAMAAGLPVIATRIGGIPDLVDSSSNGILVNPNDPENLAVAMRILITDKNLSYLYGMEGRKKAAINHNIEDYVDKLIGFYQDICH